MDAVEDKALRIVREAKVIAYDTETTGIDDRCTIVGHVVCDGTESLYVPVAHGGGGNILDADGFRTELNKAFAERERRKLRTVGHNIGFDLRAAHRSGVFPGGAFEDTMINENLIDDCTEGYSLEACAERWRVPRKKGADIYRVLSARFGGAPDRKAMANFHRLPGDLPEVVDYATGDGVSTFALCEAQQAVLDAEDLRRPWALECALIPHVAKMHARGLKVDEAYARSLIEKGGPIDAAIDEARGAFPAGFNPRSAAAVEALFRSAGYGDADFVYTPAGKPSFREHWLEPHELGRALLTLRRLEKAKSGYVIPFLTEHLVDGRIHPVLNQSKSDAGGTLGARFSCARPNLQAFPKRNKAVGKVLRKMIIPDDGMLLVEADAKQQEPRLFAYFSGDERLLDGYRSGTMDIHDIAAAELGLPRNVAKTFGLGMLIGMRPKGLASRMRWDIEKARLAYDAFLTNAFPDIAKFQRDVVSTFKRRKYVKSVLGRRARLRDSKFAHCGVSRVIQNSAGDHLKTALLLACEYSDAHPEFQMLMTIHDSIIWQERVGADRTELVNLLESVPYRAEFNLDIPMPFEVGCGTDWAIASYGE